jgi:hypothetical protein
MAQGVTIDFNARLAKFEQGLAKATSDLNRFADTAKKNASGIDSAFKGAAGALRSLLPAATVGAFTLAFDRIAESVDAVTSKLDNIGKTSRRLGLTTEELQRIRIQAEAAGIATGVLDTAFQRFARRTGEGTLDKVFEALNIQIKDAAGNLRSNSSLWDEFGRKVSLIEDKNLQLAVAMKAVDTEGVKIVELWRSSSDAIEDVNRKIEQYGLIFDENLIGKAEAYQTELGLIRRAQEALDNRTSAGLTNQALQWERLKLRISAAKYQLLDYFGVFGTKGQTAEERAASLLDEQRQLEEQRLRISQQYINEESEARRQALEKNAQQNRIYLERNRAEREKILKILEAQESKNQKITIPGIDEQAIKGLTNDVLGSSGQTKKAKELKKAYEDMTGPASVWIDMQQRAKQIFEQTRTPIEIYIDAVRELNSLKSSGLVDQDTYNRGLEKEAQTMTTALRSIEDNSKKVTSEWQELGPVFSSAFEDAIVEGENLRGVLKGLEQDIIRIVTRNLVTKPLGDAIGGLFSSGSSGNPLSNILSAISGSLAGIFRASGGPVYAGSPYIVGERGPELFVPRQSGGIIPNNQMAAAGGVTINMTVTTPDANSFRMSEGQIGQRAAMLVRRSQRNF